MNDDRVGEVEIGEYVGDGEGQVEFDAALVEVLVLAFKVAYEQDEANGQVEQQEEEVRAQDGERELQVLLLLASRLERRRRRRQQVAAVLLLEAHS